MGRKSFRIALDHHCGSLISNGKGDINFVDVNFLSDSEVVLERYGLNNAGAFIRTIPTKAFPCGKERMQVLCACCVGYENFELLIEILKGLGVKKVYTSNVRPSDYEGIEVVYCAPDKSPPPAGWEFFKRENRD